MRNYQFPPEANEKEKIIGGFMTNVQLVIIVVGILFGLLVGGLLAFVIKGFAFIPGILVASIGLPFAFYTKNGLPLHILIKRKRKFNSKTKVLPNVITKDNRKK